jgi:23S rRNA (guanosine2251-2'-O)-methyltransferase
MRNEADILKGRNAVLEAFRAEKPIDRLFIQDGLKDGPIQTILREAKKSGCVITFIKKERLDEMIPDGGHQGVAAYVAAYDYAEVSDILANAKEKGEPPFILLLDGIEDPHNLGAIIRCAECAGAHGIIIPKRHAVGITPTVYKSSAGAIEHMAIAKVSNIATTIEELKKKGVWIFTSEAEGTPYYETDFNCACAVVLGSEGNGVSKIVKDNSDYIVSIPMYGKVNSLNVSTAASVILCHVARMQRKG